MAEKEILSRVQFMHDVEANWLSKKPNFIPKSGEIVIYDREDLEMDGALPPLPSERTSRYSSSRYIVGDGITPLKDLSFSVSNVFTEEEKTKLSTIETGANSSPIVVGDSVNSIVGKNHDSIVGGKGFPFTEYTFNSSSDTITFTVATDGKSINWKSYDSVAIITDKGHWIGYLEVKSTTASTIVLRKFALWTDGGDHSTKSVEKLYEELQNALVTTGHLVNISNRAATGTEIFGDRSMAIGDSNLVSGTDSLVIGEDNRAGGANSFVSGRNNIGSYGSLVAGHNNVAQGHYSHLEGGYNMVAGNTAHAEGYGNIVDESCGHAEGMRNRASGAYAHVEGTRNAALGMSSHAEGAYNTASGATAHVEGGLYYDKDNTFIRRDNLASGDASHVEGLGNVASGRASHAGGDSNIASGTNAYATGFKTYANGTNSFSAGGNTIAAGVNQMVIGQYNIVDESNQYVWIAGNGKAPDAEGNERLSNAHTLDWKGNAWFAGNVTVGTDKVKLATEDYVSDAIETGLNDAVLFTKQGLTEAQKIQAQMNIGIVWKAM